MLNNFRAANGLLIPLFILSLSGALRAQEPVRSAALPPLISAYRRNPETFFRLGPFQEVLVGTLTSAYTDNVNLTETDKISDLSFSLGMILNSTWVLSHLNQLTFNFGGTLTENFYDNGRHQFTVAVAPNSALEFKFALADYEVRLYDQFSYTQNPTADPTAGNTANLNSLTNTIGAVVEKDLNIAILSLGADYTYNNQSGTSAGGGSNAGTTGTRQSFRVSPALTLQMTPEILYGLNAAATRSSALHQANVNTFNFGPFMRGKLGRRLEFDLAAGATLINTTPSIAPTYYAVGLLRYQLDRRIALLFSGSHQLIFTTGTSLTEQNTLRLGVKWDATRAVSVHLSPFLNFGNIETTVPNSGVNTGPYTQLGIEAGIAWRPRRRWTTELVYNYIRREEGSSGSGTSNNNYIQNNLSLSISYAF
jgi:hypothetical protein